MATKKTKQSSEESLDISSSDAALDEAIDGLRGVLKKDSDGDLPDFGADTFGAETSTDLSTFGDFSDDNSEPAFDGGDFADVSAAPAAPGSALAANMDLIMDIPIDVQIVLGSSRMPVSGLMSLAEGAIIALDKKIGEPVEITVNGRKIGRGEITVLEHDDTRFGIKLTEIYNAKKS